MAIIVEQDGERWISEAEAHKYAEANGLWPYAPLKRGDTVTIDGVYRDKPNPAWRWWAFWRPRWVASSDLQRFYVLGSTSNEMSMGEDA